MATSASAPHLLRMRGGGCTASTPVAANPDGTTDEKIKYIEDELNKAGGFLFGSKQDIVMTAARMLGVQTVKVYRKRGETDRHKVQFPEIVDGCVRKVKALKAEAEAQRTREREEDEAEDAYQRRLASECVLVLSL